MALIKEPYGLVYNTDGSLCVTYRDDDIPFPGVRSFAVEEATTNLFSLPVTEYYPFDTWNILEPDPTGRFESVIRANPGASYVYKTISTTIDSAYSSQVWCYVSPDCDSTLVRLRNEYSLTGNANYNLTKKGTWQLLELENIIAKSESCRLVLNAGGLSFTTGYVLFARLQLEQKPFCTSYVDGSRPDGLLKIRLDLDVNDAVVNFWFKIGSIFELDSFGGTRIIAFSGDIPPQNRFFIRADGYTNNATLKFYDSIDGVGPNLKSTMENIDLVKWNMFTIVFDNGLIKIYLNENLLTQYTVSLNPIALKYLNIPEITPEYLKTGFWSNLYFGKYRKPNGEIIWTDEYIREVYEEKIPFTVQNKLSIY